MNKTKLAELVLAEWPVNIRAQILEELAKDDLAYWTHVDCSFVPWPCSDIWPQLSMSERLIAYAAAAERAANGPDPE